MKHLSAYEELGAKWRAVSHPITDRWPPRHSSLWDGMATSLHGHADTDESSTQCLPPVRPSRQKAGHRYSEPPIGSQKRGGGTTGNPGLGPPQVAGAYIDRRVHPGDILDVSAP